MNKKIMWSVIGITIVAILALVVLSSQKQAPQSAAEAGKMKIAAGFYPFYFFSQQIGGDKVSVTDITPAGAEPHDYEPTASDIVAIDESRILVLNGAVEPWAHSVVQNLDPQRTTAVMAAEGLTDQTIVEEGQEIVDPHVWLSPPLAKVMVDRIEKAFEAADPANATYYQTNASALKASLDDLDAAYKQGLAGCAQKDIITSHAAFGYLATAYGLRQVSIAGLSPDAEPSAQELGNIAKFAEENHIKYIFFESLVSPKLSQTIASEVGAQTMVLNPIEGLTDEQLAAGKNYLTEMRSNLANLQIALQCKT